MTGDRARSALAGTRFATVAWVDETGSTNADLLEAARAGEPEQVLVADHQTAGRGRLGRGWHSPPGGSLTFSVLVRPALPAADGHLLTSALAVAAIDVLTSWTPSFVVGLKWPNDLVAPTAEGERKLAGILAESVVVDGRLDAVVIGMGVNVAWGPAADVPAELEGIAVSLDQLVPDAAVDREDLLVGILRGFEDRLAAIASDDGRATLHEDLLARCVTLGRPVVVVLADRSVEGTASELRPTGELVVDPADGRGPLVVTAGDIVHLR